MHRVVRLVSHRRAVVVLVALGITFSSGFLPILIAAHLILLTFFQTVASKATRRLEQHIINIGHETILVLIKHTLIVLIILIPLLRISWVLFGEDKDQISLFESGVLIWIGNHILDFLKIFAIVINITINLSPELLGILLVIQILISLKIDPCRSVEAERNHGSSSCQVVEQLRVSLAMVVLRHLNVVKVGSLHMREV